MPEGPVVVGPHTYELRSVRDLADDDWGVTAHRYATISVDDSRMTSSQVRETVLHELLHCVLFATGASRNLHSHDADLEEQMLTAVCPMLLDTLGRNRDLVDWLAGPS